MGPPPRRTEEPKLIARHYQRTNEIQRSTFGSNAVLDGDHALEGFAIHSKLMHFKLEARRQGHEAASLRRKTGAAS